MQTALGSLKGGLRLSRSNQVTYGWSGDWILRSKTLIVQMHRGRWGWCGKFRLTTPARARQRVQPQVHHSGLAVRRAEGLVIGLSSQATLPTPLSPLQLEPGIPKGPFQRSPLRPKGLTEGREKQLRSTWKHSGESSYNHTLEEKVF